MTHFSLFVDSPNLTQPRARFGKVNLQGGTATVNEPCVTENSLIYLTHQAPSGTIGLLSIGAITSGVSFRIDSASVLDTSTVAWMLANL